MHKEEQQQQQPLEIIKHKHLSLRSLVLLFNYLSIISSYLAHTHRTHLHTTNPFMEISSPFLLFFCMSRKKHNINHVWVCCVCRKILSLSLSCSPPGQFSSGGGEGRSTHLLRRGRGGKRLCGGGGEGVFVTIGSNNVENKRDDEPQTHKEYIYICKKEEAFFFHTTQVPSPVQSNATQEKRNSIEFGEL